MPVDTSMYRVQQPTQNVISDFWQPNTGGQLIGAMQAAEQTKAMQVRNRLLFMEEKDKEEARRQEAARMSYLIGQGDPGTGAAPGTPPPPVAPAPPPQNNLAAPPQAPTQSAGPPMSVPAPQSQPAPAPPPEAPSPQPVGPVTPEMKGQYAGQQERIAQARAAVTNTLETAKKIGEIDPEAAIEYANNSPIIRQALGGGKLNSRGAGGVKEVVANGKVIGRWVQSPGDTKKWDWQDISKADAPVSDIGKLMKDRNDKAQSLVSSGKYKSVDEAMADPDVSAFNAEIKKKGAESSTASDQAKFLDIQQRSMAGKPVTSEEKYFARAYRDMKTMGPQAYGAMRIEMINAIPVPVYDTTTGNIEFMMRGEITAANKGNQAKGLGSRYVDAGNATKIKSKSAAFEEIENSAKQVKSALEELKKSGAKTFSNTRLAKFASALRSERDEKATRNLFDAEVKKTLTPAEVNYVTAVLNLRESAYSLRSLQGLGQGSDLLRAGIAALLPGATTPGPEYADSAMQKFDIEVETLKRGIPGLGASGKEVNDPVDIPGVKKTEKKAKPGAAAPKVEVKPKEADKPTVVETRTLKDGTVWDKLSDGSFKKR